MRLENEYVINIRKKYSLAKHFEFIDMNLIIETKSFRLF